jgi:hypothetical protein
MGLEPEDHPDLFVHWSVWEERIADGPEHRPQRYSLAYVDCDPAAAVECLFGHYERTPLVIVSGEDAGAEELRQSLDVHCPSFPRYLATQDGEPGDAWSDFDLPVVNGRGPQLRRRRKDCTLLRCVDGPHSGRQWELSPGGSLSIGRGRQCDVQLVDLHISRLHVVLEHHGDRVVLRDKSSNGLEVDGRPYRGKGWRCRYDMLRRQVAGARHGALPHFDAGLQIEHGSEITIGPSTFEFIAGALDRPVLFEAG